MGRETPGSTPTATTPLRLAELARHAPAAGLTGHEVARLRAEALSLTPEQRTELDAATAQMSASMRAAFASVPAAAVAATRPWATELAARALKAPAISAYVPNFPTFQPIRPRRRQVTVELVVPAGVSAELVDAEEDASGDVVRVRIELSRDPAL